MTENKRMQKTNDIKIIIKKILVSKIMKSKQQNSEFWEKTRKHNI